MNFRRFSDISLKWKLIIPFLFLAAMGATSLFIISYRFQNSLINVNENQRLKNLYQAFLNTIESKKQMALSLAYLTARNPDVAGALAHRDRKKLMELLSPAYQILERDFGVRQFHFHEPPATSFLRLHAPKQYGEKMESYRSTINQARITGQGVGGIEMGTLGLSIRSVVPVYYQGRQVGTVELGLSLGKPLLEEFKKNYQAELGFYLRGKSDREAPQVFATTMDLPSPLGQHLQSLWQSGEIFIQPENVGSRKMTALSGPIRDFSGRIIGLIKISVDRSPALALLQRYALVAGILGLIGLLISIAFVWTVSVLFTRRIDEVIKGADEIASGSRGTRLPVKSGDELDVMARAINRMLRSLDASQLRLKEYAQNLELMVEQRTRSLRESEQTYRTLVENVPLIVYMVSQNGEMLFLNRASEQMIGQPPEELNGQYEMWGRNIHPDDRERVMALREECLREKKELLVEYRLVHRDGAIVYCFDQAVPVVHEQGEQFRMDGIIFDITVQKELQAKNLQTQELETLTQISRQLAHELRNPLTSIGGLARRIVRSFEAPDNRAEKSQMILEQVQKLEKILNMMLTFISPQEITLKPVHFNSLIYRILGDLKQKSRALSSAVKVVNLSQELAILLLDENLFEKALLSLIENAWARMGQKGELMLATFKLGETANMVLTFQVPSLLPDDLDHYFYPFTIDYGMAKKTNGEGIPDISVSKMIIYKHRGTVNVTQENDRYLKLIITLPLQ